MAEQFLTAFITNIVEIIKYSIFKHVQYEDRMLTTLVTTFIGTIISLFTYANGKKFLEQVKEYNINKILKKYHSSITIPSTDYLHLYKKLSPADENKFTYMINDDNGMFLLYCAKVSGVLSEKYIEEYRCGSCDCYKLLASIITKIGYVIPVIVTNIGENLKIIFVKIGSPYFYFLTKDEYNECRAHVANWMSENKIVRELKDEKNNKSSSRCIYTISGNNIENTDPFKTFDNIVSVHKNRIKNMVDMLISGGFEKKYNGYAPSNLGIMLYGPAGTGKSSFIQAIANYTKRDILNVNVREVTSAEMFRKIINGRFDKYNSIKHTIESTIFVFEEIDCLDGVLSRDVEHKKNISSSPELDMLNLKKNILTKAAENCSDDKTVQSIIKQLEDIEIKNKTISPLTLDVILTELSGVNHTKERIIIATTNYPHLLDKALIRAGRFDILIKLDYILQTEIEELGLRIFREQGEEKMNLDGLKITHAESINVAVSCDNYNEFVQKIQHISKNKNEDNRPTTDWK